MKRLIAWIRDGGLSEWMKGKLFQFQNPGQPTMMDYLLSLIKGFEGFYADWYTCPGGVRTIGYGHTGRSPDLLPAPWTEAYASQVLEGELQVKYIPDVIAACEKAGIRWDGLQAYERAALVSFGYNLGAGVFSRATFIRKIAAGASAHEIERAWWLWNQGGGRILPGLVRRRFAEAKLYLTGKLDLEPAGWMDYYNARKP
jgi:lysozyme